MTKVAASFDPSGFFEFDLAAGRVKARSGERVFILSDSVLHALVSAARAGGDLSPLRGLGREVGEATRRGMGADPGGADPELVVAHARAGLALFGWGALALEQWGDALVAKLSGGPDLDEDRIAIGAVLGGFFSALVGRDVAAVPAGSTDYVLVDPSIAEEVWGWTKDGDGVGSIVEKLGAP